MSLPGSVFWLAVLLCSLLISGHTLSRTAADVMPPRVFSQQQMPSIKWATCCIAKWVMKTFYLLIIWFPKKTTTLLFLNTDIRSIFDSCGCLSHHFRSALTYIVYFIRSIADSLSWCFNCVWACTCVCARMCICLAKLETIRSKTMTVQRKQNSVVFYMFFFLNVFFLHKLHQSFSFSTSSVSFLQKSPKFQPKFFWLAQ